nr:class II aldolase/adducin family protein [Parafrankia discariae]
MEFFDLEMLKALGRRAEDDRVRLPVIANSQDMAVLGDRFEAVWRPDLLPAVVVADHGLYGWGNDLPSARRHVEAVQWLVEWALESRS